MALFQLKEFFRIYKNKKIRQILQIKLDHQLNNLQLFVIKTRFYYRSKTGLIRLFKIN